MKVRNLILIGIIVFSCNIEKNKYELAMNMLKEKKYSQSITFLNELLAEDTANSELYLLRGKVKYEIRDTIGCRTDILKAALLGNKNATEVYNQYFKSIEENSDQYAIRIHEANQLIDREPNMPDGYYNLGNVYFDKRNYEIAIEFYNKAILADKKYSAAYYNRGVCYINIHQEIKGCKDIEVAANMGYELAIQALPECKRVLQHPAVKVEGTKYLKI